ncbi:hypothetical protein [Paraburkholderia caribensis]|uniref:hypothetical protein n=1 Tax=Paraburkholderia caribensis TaxID=75105 RepID=UPI001590E6EE|nr:hypothetical protein [Paraburkholderia caribensis]
MSSIPVGSILIPAGDLPPYQTSQRVLASSGNGYWLIPLPFDGKRKYARGPKFQGAEQLHAWLDQGLLRIGEFKPPELWNNTDEDLNRWFGGTSENPCNILRVRDLAYDAITPFIDQTIRTSTLEALSTRSYTAWIREAAQTGPHAEAYLYDALNRFWAGGLKNALLGRTADNGRRGEAKPQNKKLGRRNASDKAADRASTGYPLSEDDKLKLQCGWQCFVSDGRSTYTAYLETMGCFYADPEHESEDGKKVTLLDADSRPTPKQFRYWGPAKDPAQSATRRMLGEHEYWLNHSGMHGASAEDVLVIGQRGWSDSSGGDVKLRSVISPSIELGCATVLPVMDARSDVICGMHIGLEPPSARVQLLAAAHAALPKTEWGEKFGIHGITEDQIPCVRFDQLFLDNGEGRNGQTMRVYLQAWEGWIEYAPAANGRAKGPIEGEHHVRHVEVDQNLPGATHLPYGTSRQPTLAVLTYPQYVRHHIRRILYHNCEQPVPHLITGEMRAELDVTATRMDVFRWLVRHGYVNGKPPDADTIRVHMLPSFAATITDHGIYLHRPDRGAKKEFVERCRFMGPFLRESGLLNAARRQVIPAEISLDPNDLRVAWFRTRDHGLQKLENIHPDRWLIERCTLEEILLIQDRDQLTLLQNETRAQQMAFDRIAERDTSADAAIETARAETACNPPPQAQPGPINRAEARYQETKILEQAGLSGSTVKSASNRQRSPQTTTEVSSIVEQAPPCSKQSYEHGEVHDDVMAAIRQFQNGDNHEAKR